MVAEAMEGAAGTIVEEEGEAEAVAEAATTDEVAVAEVVEEATSMLLPSLETITTNVTATTITDTSQGTFHT